MRPGRVPRAVPEPVRPGLPRPQAAGGDQSQPRPLGPSWAQNEIPKSAVAMDVCDQSFQCKELFGKMLCATRILWWTMDSTFRIFVTWHVGAMTTIIVGP